MVKNVKELNGSDNWLKEELKREERISAWDFDEGKEVRAEHALDCDARKLAGEHHFDHIRGKDMLADRNRGSDFTWMMITIGLIVVSVWVNIALDLNNFIAPVILFLAVNPGIFLWLFIVKKFPSAGYFKLAVFIAILFEIVAIYTDRVAMFRLFSIFRR